MVATGRERGELAGRRISAPGAGALTPAFDCAVGAYPARMKTGCGDRGEFAVGRICLANMVFSPAFDRAVGVYRARMVMTGGDHGELAAWRTSLSMVIASPACDFVVGVYCARIV